MKKEKQHVTSNEEDKNMMEGKIAVHPEPINLTSDDLIDPTTIEDPVVRTMVENLIKASKRREEILEATLAETKEELEHVKRLTRSKVSASEEWNMHVQFILDKVSAANAQPLTPRQEDILAKVIRLLAREISGEYTISGKRRAEFEVMKAVADKMGDFLIMFGIPEETHPLLKRISAREFRKNQKKEEEAKKND